MKKLEALNDSSITYFNVPALPKPILPKARKPERIRKKDMIHRHNSYLACLGAEAKRRVELFKQGGPDRYSDKSYPQFASIHLHPEILKEHLKDGHLPKEIPGEVGVKLSQEGSCIFKEKDEVPSSEERNFVALPNYPLARAQEFYCAVEKISMVKNVASSMITPPPPATTRSGAGIVSDPRAFEAALLKEELRKRDQSL